MHNGDVMAGVDIAMDDGFQELRAAFAARLAKPEPITIEADVDVGDVIAPAWAVSQE
jgi:hypothetical protein